MKKHANMHARFSTNNLALLFNPDRDFEITRMHHRATHYKHRPRRQLGDKHEDLEPSLGGKLCANFSGV